jgi:hypothetical protein
MDTATDPLAPWGRRKDGTPKGRPGRPPGQRNRTTKPRVTSAARARAGGSPYRRVVTSDQGGELGPEIDPGPVGEPVEFPLTPDDPQSSGAIHDPVSSLSDDPGVITSSRPRASAAVRKDITAKIALMIGLPAGIWATADPYCGTAASAAVPAFSAALADIVVDSVDLVNWFTAGGNYLKWLTLATTVAPVLQVVWGHHITHTIGVPAGEQPAFDPTYYPAPAAV